jgi:hypothetical protein
MVRARLWRGPFNGKVVEFDPSYGILTMAGTKRMTRKQRYEHSVARTNMLGTFYAPPPLPMIRAIYRPTKFMHPDGSQFYEYIEGSKREY